MKGEKSGIIFKFTKIRDNKEEREGQLMGGRGRERRRGRGTISEREREKEKERDN